MSKRRTGHPCAGRDRRGRPCGKAAPPDSQFCSVHDPSRKPQGVIAAQDSDDPAVLFKRLMKDRDPSVRLRALEGFLKWQERQSDGCPRCKARETHDRWVERVIKTLTDDERERMKAACRAFRAVQREACARVPDLRPDHYVPAIHDHQPPSEREPSDTDVAVAALNAQLEEEQRRAEEHHDHVDAGVDRPQTRSRATRAAAADEVGPTRLADLLPQTKWTDVGLVQLENGQWTHPLGDDHAQRILTGEVSLPDARTEHEAALTKSAAMVAGPVHPFIDR